MPEHVIRFGVFDGKGLRAASWRCFSPSGKDDVYLSCRELRGALKVSLHQSGAWHIAYDGRFYEESVRPGDQTEEGRYIDKWPAPAGIAHGVRLAVRIITPWSAVSTPHADMPHVIHVPKPPEGKAIEFYLFIAEPTVSFSGWPGKDSMNTSLVDSYVLPSGMSVWIVYCEIPCPDMGTWRGKPRFFKRKTMDDIKDGCSRVLTFRNGPDGSKIICDCKVTYENRGTSDAPSPVCK